jgi:hypothetical protein
MHLMLNRSFTAAALPSVIGAPLYLIHVTRA